jgi:hypothetical protein
VKQTRPVTVGKAAKSREEVRQPAAERFLVLLTGVWIAVSLIKFGNPVIFDRMIEAPRDIAEFVFVSWPVSWGYVLLAAVALAAIRTLRPAYRKEQWPIAFLGFWLFWQFLSSTQTVDPKLTQATLIHFVSCGVSFVVGWWALSRCRLGPLFWTPLLLGFFYVLFNGFDQHHGGLESMRKAFYERPDWQTFPKEYLLKMQSNRIFSTLVYPNALAGVILLFLPIALWKTWDLTKMWPRVARGVALGLYAYLGVGCLYWSGSKGGWLIALAMAAALILHLDFSLKAKRMIVVAGLLLGLGVFFIRFGGYFQKGATSVGARFTYWQAAVQTVKERPLFGTGPGTFSVAYRKIKPPDAEMAKLAHNDYLEQASDSGIPGGIAFAGFVLVSLAALYRPSAQLGGEHLMLWIGLAGWAAQAVIEFGLYIPALAWPAFLWFGWLWGVQFGEPADGLR